KEKNLDRMARLLPEILEVPSKLVIAANHQWEFMIMAPISFPRHWDHDLETMEVRLDDKVIDPSRYNEQGEYLELKLPPILAERADRPSLLELKVMFSFDTDNDSWEVPLDIRIPIDVVAPGYLGTTYHELDKLPANYQDFFEGITAIAWHPDGEEHPAHLSLVFPSLALGNESGAAYFRSRIPIENARSLTSSSSLMGFEFGPNWLGGLGNFDAHTFLLDRNFNEPTIDAIFEPEPLVTPSPYIQAMGVPGMRVVVEDIPIRWLDNDSAPTSLQFPSARIEAIEGEADAPLFGPSRLGPSDDLDDIEHFMTWLSPKLLVRMNADGTRSTLLSCGSPGNPPRPASLRLRFVDPDHGECTRLFDIPAEHDGVDGQIQRSLEVIGAPLEPGTTAAVEFRGFPICVRRDQRGESTWFGGTVTVEVPVFEAVMDRATRRYVPRSTSEDSP
ncbi:MAG: hypothetical protein MK085_08520, partial [Phycisphaerales bacterium]|nr:hypothetical protein [Phycisphaerales bacterium]